LSSFSLNLISIFFSRSCWRNVEEVMTDLVKVLLWMKKMKKVILPFKIKLIY